MHQRLFYPADIKQQEPRFNVSTDIYKVFDTLVDKLRVSKASSIVMFLRAITLGSKFVLIFYLAKVLQPEDIGIYGLTVVTVNFCMYVVGLDFYVYSQREILSGADANRATLVRDQLVFYSIWYLVVLPVIFSIFFVGLMPLEMWKWFYVLLVLEHISHEGYRLLIVIHRPILAGWALFLRSGAWVYAVLMIMLLEPVARDLSLVWLGWAVGATGSIVLVFMGMKSLDWSATSIVPVNWRWIKRGIGIALPFLLGSLAYRGLFTVDRYVISIYLGAKAVGVYTVYIGIMNAVLAFVDGGAITTTFPKLVSAIRQGRVQEQLLYKASMIRGVAVVVIVLNVLVVFVAPFFLSFIGREVYMIDVEALWILLVAGAFFAASNVPHYILYAQARDKVLIGVHILGLFLSTLLLTLLVPKYGIVGAALSILSAAMFVFLAKTIMLVNFRASMDKET
jgi:O-antigen/teichoic acid export membrane protein